MLDGTVVLRDGTTVRQGDAFCLEPQNFPNAPNEPRFPSAVLRPGERYRARIVLRFGVVDDLPLHRWPEGGLDPAETG
jgi:aldose 1-epimerase